MRSARAFVVTVAVAGAAAAQAAVIEVSLADGKVVQAAAITGALTSGLDLQVGSERQRIDGGAVVALHGGPARAVDLPTAYLAGGDVLRGALVGGDAAGDRLDLLSPVLGSIDVHVDRLEAFTTSASIRPSAMQLPAGVGEALFQRAVIGHDVIAGSLHQFGEQGVRFEPEGSKAPRWFAPSEFLALRIADAAPRAKAAPALLVTRTGDRLGVVVRAFTGASVTCEREGGAVFDVRLADVASLSFADAATFLSDLAPAAVAESGFDGDVVHPWQKDAAVVGTPLVVAGRTHAKGLGVHGRSRITFTVPPGVDHFWTRVGIDDSSAELGVLANADVRVLVDDVVKFEQKGLATGALRDTGLVAVRPGGKLALEVDFGSGRDIGDRVDWLSPVFLPGGGRR